MIAVLKHELRTYFRSLTAYVFGAFLLQFIGIGSVLYNLQAAVSNFELVLSFSCLVFAVIVPILTMRVLAEERKQKTDQLPCPSPPPRWFWVSSLHCWWCISFPLPSSASIP